MPVEPGPKMFGIAKMSFGLVGLKKITVKSEGKRDHTGSERGGERGRERGGERGRERGREKGEKE